MKIIKSILASGFGILLATVMSVGGLVRAQETPNGISVSPSSEKIVLTPGDNYSGTVTVRNPSTTGESFNYEAHTDSFFVENGNEVTLGTQNDYTKMKDWITLSNEKGTLGAGESAEINYTISVPNNAPAGGQYAAVVVATVPSQGGSEGATIREVWQIASTIYASVAGETTLSGEIRDNDIPSFVLNPPVQASFVVENKGNVHTDATYYMQVYPLFSNEEVYTNEEEPEVSNIMPGATRTIVSSWDGAPQVGIFKVVQTVKAFGGESVVEKMVIICPIWLLFLIIFVIAAIIIWIVLRIRSRGKSSRRSTESEA